MSDRRSRNQARYDFLAPAYAALLRAASMGRISRLYQAAAEALDVAPDATVLELGCGPATVTPHLLERLGPAGRIIGVDVSGEMIARAKQTAAERGWERVEYVQCDALEYTPPRPVDAVVFCLSLSAMPQIGRCLDRALAMLEPRGQVVVVDSMPLPRRPIQNFVMRRKAPLVGADPDALLRARVAERLEEARLRPLFGGVYCVLSGRRPAGGEA